MKKFIGLSLLGILIWQAFANFNLFIDYTNGLWPIEEDTSTDKTIYDICVYIFYSSIIFIIVIIIAKIFFKDCVKCSHCKKNINKISKNRTIDIKFSKYRFTNKDGSKNLKRKDNWIWHSWHENYICPKCKNVTTLEEVGRMPFNKKKEGESNKQKESQKLKGSGGAFDVVLIELKKKSKTKLYKYIIQNMGYRDSSARKRSIKRKVDYLDEYKIEIRLDKVFTKQEAKMEVYYLTTVIGASAIYFPHINNWLDLSEEEKNNIIKKEKNNMEDYTPTPEEIKNHFKI